MQRFRNILMISRHEARDKTTLERATTLAKKNQARLTVVEVIKPLPRHTETAGTKVTIVAAGTSAPEFAISLVGVLKGRYGISAGNVIGSDIFNLLGVLWLAGLLRPVEVDPMSRYSLAALSGMVFVVLLFMRTGWRLSRLEGLALIVIAALRWAFDFSAHVP